MRITKRQLRKLIRESLRKAHVTTSNNRPSDRLVENVRRVALLNEAYGPRLLEGCKNSGFLIMEEALPAAIKSMTVQEVLDTIEKLEKTQEERQKIAEVVESQEKNILKLKKKIKESIADLPEAEQRRRNKKYDRLTGLDMELTSFLEQQLQPVKKKLVDPDADVGWTTLLTTSLKLSKDYGVLMLKNGRSVMTDLKLGDWKEIFDVTGDVLGKLESIPGVKSVKSAYDEVGDWLSRGAKAFSWLVRKAKGTPEPPASMLDDLVDDIAQSPDTKTKTAPFMNLFNINDEYQAMLEDSLEVQFINDYKQKLKDFPLKDTKMEDLENMQDSEWDIDTALEKWIPQQSDTEDHSVEDIGGGG